jgi:hypothetical protein
MLDIFWTKAVTYYDMYRVRTIEKLEVKIGDLSAMARYIELICSGQLLINRRPTADIEKDIVAFGLPIRLLDDVTDRMKTLEYAENLREKREKLIAEQKYYKEVSPVVLYAENLNTLRGVIEKHMAKNI